MAARRPPPLASGAAAEPLIGAKAAVPRWQRLALPGWERLRLPIYTVLLLVASVGNTVYFKRMTDAMPNYGWYLTMLSTVVYVPFFAALAGQGLLLTKQELVPKFCVMGLCDGLSGIFMILGGVHTSGTLQVVLSQAVIPFTMLASMGMLGKRYHLLQMLGAACIVLGIVLAKAGGSAPNEDNMLVFNVLFVVSLVPSAFSSVFKEVAFRGFDGDLDVNVVQFWVAGFQVLVNILGMPVYALRLLGAQQVPLGEMPGLTLGGTRCLFFLENQVVGPDCDLPESRPCDHCHGAWAPVMGYLAFNLCFNICTMQVIKHGSATLSFLVSTLRMPLSSLAFSSSLVMGAHAVPVGLGDCASLCVIVAGLLVYRSGAKRQKAALEDRAPWPSPTDSAPRSAYGAPAAGGGAKWRLAPLFATGTPMMQPAFILVRESGPKPRSAERVRHDLYNRLGAASPLHSPGMRGRSPPASPRSPASPGSLSPRSPRSQEGAGGEPEFAITGDQPEA